MTTFSSCFKLLRVPAGEVYFYSLEEVGRLAQVDLARLPFCVKVFLEMMVRMQPHAAYTPEHILGMARWSPEADADQEYPFMPARVLLQDFTGVPALVDLAAMRTALERMGKDPAKVEPQIPVSLVIDHSVQIDEYQGEDCFALNLRKEFERNRERYEFLKWGEQAFEHISVLPPGLGICHQVNMEYLGQCAATTQDASGRTVVFPDTVVGTDSHTPMINSMGIIGWGVGGIEAEAAMLGQPMPLVSPKVVGCRLSGRIPAGCTPTDLALLVTQQLRKKGVVGQFVEFFGEALDHMTVADRAPLSNMAPEYGATMGLFPVDRRTLDYLRETGRDEEHIALVEAYCRAQGMFREAGSPEPQFNDIVDIDLSALRPALAGPRKPHERIELQDVAGEFHALLRAPVAKGGFALSPGDEKKTAEAAPYGKIGHGSVVIASITSCTNTSNPTLMIGAALLARNALARGLKVPPYVKTSFAPGSRVVTDYLRHLGVQRHLDDLGFLTVAYGCTTCIGNSGPLRPEIDQAIRENGLVVAAVLSGNRNFEGRIHPLTKANYLGSPLLVVAYALAGNMNVDLEREPLGEDGDGKPVYLKDIWPSETDIADALNAVTDPGLYPRVYAAKDDLSPEWAALSSPTGPVYTFDEASTYIRNPPFFDGFAGEALPVGDIRGARVLALLGDFITTDHISPAGSIPADSPAAQYLNAHGVANEDFNSLGARRGNHEVMMRGTFANIRIRNRLVEREGGYTVHHPAGEEMSIYDAAMKYRAEGTPLVVIGGREYGAGSSRDWAAKGPGLLGVRAVIAETYERIHRSNLVGMGVLPLEFLPGENAEALGLTGTETLDIAGIADGLAPGKLLAVTATNGQGEARLFQVKCRIDTPVELEYYRYGGILPYVLKSTIA